ncbi:hypothetical protein DIU31_016600 [Mucilaginibacter rubeus]|uniref:GTPase-associated system helical domain-containing protein n=1 Tax=Mucilaginibacter rubeus TaxID=2027860 RepID=A0AAE6JGC1_9SPHI|nr:MULTISPECIES: GTPase-associated system all-helical protein GASH [Mucilaginibacter]QEM05053.1 hypothetical protein DIU31_016600 [Mucilaginibacter rubeus]QEM17647.1 hypothetical protein DIU38_016770 [Mucilaginibacter gossypii]QTE45830.1 hypothetical protein J3L19_10920 [Mucilaginibacter rubeus]QTE52427.1 hypothetical protein J3L21_10895 [Mucilaginibacter rubeus]QTE57515.1 hypothetical protein J3L23_02565 [Mucilaginibacter rubeus]
MLQTFLKNNLITLTDDQQLEKLKKSSQELVKRIKKEKSRIYSFALAGIDPNIPAENNEIAEVKEIFERTWPTYAAITRDTPIPFIRAVILNALVELAADMAIANLIYLSTKDVVKHLTFSPVEEVTIKVFLSDIAQKITIAAYEKFRIRHAINNTLISTEGVKRPIVDEAITKKVLEGDYGDGTLPTFIPKVVKSYTAAINKAHLDTQNNLEMVSGSINALGLKTELIWWKTTAYSPMLKSPYDVIASPVLEIALAADFATFVPAIFPESVDYFLSATVEEIAGNDDVTLTSFLNSLNSNADALSGILKEQSNAEGRISLLDFVSGLVHKKYELKDLKTKVGVDEDLKLKPGSLTTWLFHDFLCNVILTSK